MKVFRTSLDTVFQDLFRCLKYRVDISSANPEAHQMDGRMYLFVIGIKTFLAIRVLQDSFRCIKCSENAQ